MPKIECHKPDDIMTLWPIVILNTSKNHTFLVVLPNLSQRYDSSSEILRFVNIVHDRLCETFSNFYHSLHLWYHEILTNLMIFRVCLLFLEFKNHFATRLWSCFLIRCSKFLYISQVRPHTLLSNMNIILHSFYSII